MKMVPASEDDVAWLALLASGVDGSESVARVRFAEQLQRLRSSAAQHAPAADACEPRAPHSPLPQPLEGAMT